jgi:death on curing protein
VKEPVWILKTAVLAAHSLQLAEHGGPDGIRDETLLDSALAKPQNVFAYEPDANIFRLAASYAVGIARNHPFVDGNKRTALAVSTAFMVLNGWDLVAPREDLYSVFLGVPDGSIQEGRLAEWLKHHGTPFKALT